MDNASLQKIKDIIAGSQKVVIAVGSNPHIDQMAGALSLYLALSSANKKVSVLSATEPIVELSSLVGIDKVKTSHDGSGGDLVVSFPYREGEIEKVSYTIDDGYLNIVVKAGEDGLTFEENDVIFKRGSDKADLVMTVGMPTLDELNTMLPEESMKEATIINIDNSNNNAGFGDIVLVSNKFSSLSEQVADLLLNLDFDFDTDTAQNLLSGITYATENFQNPQTSFLAFEIAAILMKRGAVRVGSNQGYQRTERRAENRLPQRQEQSNRPQQQNMSGHQQPQQGQPSREDRREAIRNALRQRAQGRGQNSPRNNQPQAGQQNHQDNRQDDHTPSDWLTPKVYKGSTDVS